MNQTVSSSLYRIVKTEPSIVDGVVEQKEQHTQEILRLRKSHSEQIAKLCQELEKSSILIHQVKLELDSTRVALNQKEKELIAKTNPPPIEYLQNKNSELMMENIKIKKELATLTKKYQILSDEMQDARQYLLNMIATLN